MIWFSLFRQFGFIWFIKGFGCVWKAYCFKVWMEFRFWLLPYNGSVGQTWFKCTTQCTFYVWSIFILLEFWNWFVNNSIIDKIAAFVSCSTFFLFIPILWLYRTWRTLICFSIIHFHWSFVYISTLFKINEESSSPMTKVIPIESNNNDNICPRYQKWLKRIKKIDLHDSRKNKGKNFINFII